MSDTNDKKPTSPYANWQQGDAAPQQGQPYGHVADDPLAELDRIVNQDYSTAGVGHSPSGVVSDGELKLLEEDLLRELRGQMPDLGQPAAQPSAPAPVAPSLDAAPQGFAQSAQPNLGGFGAAQNEPQYAAPDYAQQPVEPPQVQPSIPPMPGGAPEQSYVSEPVYAPEPAPVAPEGPSFGGFGSPEPSASVAPSVAAPSYDDGLSRSGSYGELSRSATPTQPVAPQVTADPYSAAAASSDYAQSMDYTPSNDLGANIGAAHASHPDIAPQMSAPAVDAPSVADGAVAHGYHTLEEEVRTSHYDAGGYAAEQAPNAAPDVVSGYTADPASDPYAAFNQASAAPSVEEPAPAAYPSYESSDNYASDNFAQAPNVDVSGQNVGGVYGQAPQGTDAGYPAAGYQAAGASDAGALSSDYPMASGPHGTYADPGVMQAAAEANPYLQDDGDYAAGPVDNNAGAKDTQSRKWLIGGIAAVAVVIVGGLAVWGFGGSSDGGSETPVLVADGGKVKRNPIDAGGKVVPHQNKEVYKRIDGSASDEGPSKMMPAGEKPLALTQDGRSPRVISLSGGESAISQAPNQPVGSGNGAVAPKRVRTVIVRPDGSIVSTNGQNGSAASNATPSVNQQMLASTPSEQAMNQSFNNGVTGAAGGAASSPTVVSGPLPRAKPAALIALQAAQRSTQPAAVSNNSAPASTAPAGPAPLSLVPGGNNASRPAAAAPVRQAPAAQASSGGGYTVQVTSQRTPEQARSSYANIQSRLASVLGGYQPDIKAANLGDRGTFYRVRVGSFSDRSGATAFCNSIKAAGGDCLVARK